MPGFVTIYVLLYYIRNGFRGSGFTAVLVARCKFPTLELRQAPRGAPESLNDFRLLEVFLLSLYGNYPQKEILSNEKIPK